MKLKKKIIHLNSSINNNLQNLSIIKLSDKSYKELCEKAEFIKVGPFNEIGVLNAIDRSLIKLKKLKSAIVKFSIINNSDEILALGLFFQIKINKTQIILSGGRFGYSQIRILSKKIDESEILKCFDKFCHKNMISLCSLSFGFNRKYEKYFSNSWKLRNVNYLMADIDNSCNKGKLNFPAALKRTSLSRGIKLSKKNNISSILTTSEEILEQWYLSCHLPRMKELRGKTWELDIFRELLKSKYGGLCIAKNDSNIVIGGCFYIKNSCMLELFMMSTTRDNQKIGVNYALAEKLYAFASESKLKWLNWQGSNPPMGPLVDFKKKWNSNLFSFNIFTKRFDKNVSIQELRSKIPDFFIYPES